VITSHPRSIAAAAGSNVQFSVTATANMAGGLRYQWLHESVSITGATNATLTILNARARHVGAYTVLVTNAAGRFARSRPARLGIGVGAFGVDKIEDLPLGDEPPAGFAASAARTKSTSFMAASNFNPPVYDTNNTYASLFSTAGHVGSTDPTPCQTVVYSSIHFGPFSVDDDAVVTVDTVGATFRSVLAAYAGLRTVSGTTTNYSYFRTLLNCDKSTSALDFNQRVTFNAAPGVSNIYTVLADGLDGAVANLQLSVNIRSRRPVILQPPVSTVTTQGMSAEFSVAVAGVGPFFYQWFSNGTAIAGAVLDRLLLQNVTPNFASADFSVRVTNTFAMVTSAPVRVTVLVPPSVSIAPAAVFANRFSTVVFAAQAQGTPPPVLRWFFTPAGGTPTLLTGENSATLQRNAVNDPHAGTYTVQASNTVGTATASAVLVVGDAPQFVLQPAPARVRFGTGVQFSAVAGGSPPIDYLWRKEPGTVAQTWTRHGSNYVIIAAEITLAGSYRVVASNAFGTATSSNASLVVAYPVLLDYRVSHTTNGAGNSQQIFDWLELIVSNSWPGVSNVFVLEGTDQPANAQWNPILTNTQPINPLVITQQMNLTNRLFQFYRVNPPP
jgi:Immunoglobulin domain/Immunoglobulin I-set domain